MKCLPSLHLTTPLQSFATALLPLSKQEFYPRSPSSSLPQSSLSWIFSHYSCTPNNFPVPFQTVPLLSGARERTRGSQEIHFRNEILKCSSRQWSFDPWLFWQLRWNQTGKSPSHAWCQCLWMHPAGKLSENSGKQQWNRGRKKV